MDDATAIRNCKNGENDAFRYLVERYQRQAVGHAVAILGGREDALDAVQDAFIDAFRSLGKFDDSRCFYPWFYVLLRNRCYKTAAKRRETEGIGETEILASTTHGPNVETLDLETALLSLPKEDREILTLKYLDGLSYEELAAQLQIPKGTVMSRLFYARKRLQGELSKPSIGKRLKK